jgi:GrpB-like predicted nucleotidyltransferase (UPF0157 family)
VTVAENKIVWRAGTAAPTGGLTGQTGPVDGVEIIGGPERRPIVIVAYRPAWAEAFEEHRARISGVLGARAVRVDHIGSTSVPGLAAKPIVDIQVSVVDIADEAAYAGGLMAAGYALRVREDGHRMFRTTARDVHVHVCGAGSGWERRHILFRDWLRRCADDRAAYAALKQRLAQRSWDTMDDYAEAKTGLVAEIMVRAEAWAAGCGWVLP